MQIDRLVNLKSKEPQGPISTKLNQKIGSQKSVTILKKMEKNREKEQQGPKNVTLKTFVSR